MNLVGMSLNTPDASSMVSIHFSLAMHASKLSRLGLPGFVLRWAKVTESADDVSLARLSSGSRLSPTSSRSIAARLLVVRRVWMASCKLVS